MGNVVKFSIQGKFFDCSQNQVWVPSHQSWLLTFQNVYFDDALNRFSKMKIEGIMPNEYDTFVV
jgi:hypothetical protein